MSLEKNLKDSENSRIICFDYLRVLATLSVILLHVSAQNWGKAEVTSFEWQIFNFFDSIARWGVPIFVMISGAIFLNKEYNIEKIYKKNILRMITAFVFWSILYGIISFFQGASFKDSLLQMIRGHYHMWFIFMIIGLYMFIPFYNKIVKSEKLLKYYLILSFVFAFAIPQCITVLSFVDMEISNALDSILDRAQIYFILGYSGYFILGYYLYKKKFSRKRRYLIYALSFFGFVGTVILTSVMSIQQNKATLAFYNNFSINVLMESIGVFVFFQTIVNIEKFEWIFNKTKVIMLKLSKYSFGAYLVHALIIEQMNILFGINTLIFNPIVSTLALTLIVFMVSFFVSFILNHVPILKKYVV